MEHCCDFVTRFMSMFDESKEDPFEDGSDFESFVPSNYKNISKKVLEKTSLDSPLKIFKFVLVKVNTPYFSATEIHNELLYKKMLNRVKEAKKSFEEFDSKKIQLTERETKYLKSAHATQKFAEIAMTVCGKSTELESQKLHEFYLANPENIKKLGQICKDILEGNNPIGEGLVTYAVLIRDYLIKNHSYEVLRFILCMLVEALKRTKKNRADQGLIAKNPWMKRTMSRMETNLKFYKMTFLGINLTTSSALLTIGSDPDLERIKSDEENGKMLMKLLENCKKEDNFHEVPSLIKSYDEAKDTYQFMLKLADQLEDSEFHKRMYDQENLEGICQSYMAAFTDDPAEIYRLSVNSMELLEEIVDNIEGSVVEYELLMEAIDENLRRLWKIKYDNYQQEKTEENLKDLKKMATKRILFGKMCLINMNDAVGTFPDWWVLYDWTKCIFLVFNDLACVSRLAAALREVLLKGPENVANFERHSGMKFDPAMSSPAFCAELIRSFKPNEKVLKMRNPFEDTNDFENFVSFYYNIPIPKKVFENANLSIPFNTYKFLLIKLLHAKEYAEGNDKPGVSLEKLQKLKQKYKEIMSQKISMTVEERKMVKSAFATLQLAEIYFKSFDANGKFEIAGVDFQKLGSACSDILDGYAEEVPIVYLLGLFDEMWKIKLNEECRFLLCVMTEVLKKTQAIRTKNDTFANHCPCVAETITEFVILEVNYASLLFFTQMFTASSVSFTLNAPELSEKPKNVNGDAEKLMKLFENYEAEEEFHEIPKKAVNYDQAKITFEWIMKLCDQRKARKNKQKTYESNYFEGLARSDFATFVSDPKEVYKLCRQSVDLLQKCLKIEQPVDELKSKIKEFKPDAMIDAIDENYRRMLNIKYDTFKKDKTEENQYDLSQIAVKRVDWAKKSLSKSHVTRAGCSYPKWWIRLDLIKCHLQVNKNETAAGKCAEDLHKELMDDSVNLKLFNDIVGINFDRTMSKENFVKILLKKLK